MAPNDCNVDFTEDMRDLDDNELGCVDDLIDLLARKNHTRESGIENRGSFFKVVFTNWNTSMIPPKPQPLADRTNDSLPPVARLVRDCPFTAAADAEAGIPACAIRRAGQLVYLQLTVERGISLMGFTYCDPYGHPVPEDSLELLDGMNASWHRARVMEAWDRQEVTRIGQYNRSMVVYWARKRVIRVLHLRGALEAPGYLTQDEQPDILPEIYTSYRALTNTIDQLTDTLRLMDSEIFSTSDLPPRFYLHSLSGV